MAEITHGEKVKLDSKDKAILEQLQENARQSIAEVAKNTKLPRDVVVYRIKKLEKNKVIRAYHTLLNSSKLGYPLYIWVLFVCNNITTEEESRFIKFLKDHKNIIYVSKCSGKYDFSIGICARDYEQYDGIIREIRLKFPRIIRDIETVPTTQEYKFDWMVDLI
ncbi:MAG: Lrp/AsnC family transcriptional regulator [Nanoarchaeota archaeon]|nr:Lrp/AsnC family transcriptional regulator [Nanoarchaeota archaeon]